MNADPVFAEIARWGVVPVIAIESVEWALPLADALLEGGLGVAEITFRTEAAAEVIARMVQKRPALLVGAGTVLTEANVRAAKAAGARFAVAPGLNPVTVRAAQDAGLPFAPGVCTPSEIELALGLGCSVIKFFPSEAVGRRRHAAGAGRAVRAYRRPFHADRRHQRGEPGELPLLQVGGGGRRHVDRPAGRPRRRQVASHPRPLQGGDGDRPQGARAGRVKIDMNLRPADLKAKLRRFWESVGREDPRDRGRL